MDKKQIVAYLTMLKTDITITNRDEIIDYCVNEIKQNIERETKEKEILELLSGLVSDVGNLLCDVADLDYEWQQAGYYEGSKLYIKELGKN